MEKPTLIKNLEISIQLKQQLLSSPSILETIEEMSRCIIECYKNGGKVLFCGNGGSAADAQHLSAELSGRYYLDRPPLFAEALHVNTSNLTAVANDYSYNDVFARLTQAMGKEGDVLLGLSTSGTSKNVVKALAMARSLNMKTFSFTGQGGGDMKALSDYIIEVPSVDPPRIQECHILLGHTICEIVEREIFETTSNK